MLAGCGMYTLYALLVPIDTYILRCMRLLTTVMLMLLCANKLTDVGMTTVVD